MTKSQAKPAADKFKVFEDWLGETGAEFSTPGRDGETPGIRFGTQEETGVKGTRERAESVLSQCRVL